MDIMETIHLCILLSFVFIIAIFKDHLRKMLFIDRSKGEPLLSEEALVYAKSDHGCIAAHSESFYVVHFYVATRDTVVDCEVPKKIWSCLEKGQRGTLCHRGGEFHSFKTENYLYRNIYITGY